MPPPLIRSRMPSGRGQPSSRTRRVVVVPLAAGFFGGLGLLLVLAALKPLVTALCLGSGASGGLFTPRLSTGAVLGGELGLMIPMIAAVVTAAMVARYIDGYSICTARLRAR